MKYIYIFINLLHFHAMFIVIKIKVVVLGKDSFHSRAVTLAHSHTVASEDTTTILKFSRENKFIKRKFPQNSNYGVRNPRPTRQWSIRGTALFPQIKTIKQIISPLDWSTCPKFRIKPLAVYTPKTAGFCFHLQNFPYIDGFLFSAEDSQDQNDVSTKPRFVSFLFVFSLPLQVSFFFFFQK